MYLLLPASTGTTPSAWARHRCVNGWHPSASRGACRAKREGSEQEASTRPLAARLDRPLVVEVRECGDVRDRHVHPAAARVQETLRRTGPGQVSRCRAGRQSPPRLPGRGPWQRQQLTKLCTSSAALSSVSIRSNSSGTPRLCSGRPAAVQPSAHSVRRRAQSWLQSAQHGRGLASNGSSGRAAAVHGPSPRVPPNSARKPAMALLARNRSTAGRVAAVPSSASAAARAAAARWPGVLVDSAG